MISYFNPIYSRGILKYIKQYTFRWFEKKKFILETRVTGDLNCRVGRKLFRLKSKNR